jgi:hypothetical protein
MKQYKEININSILMIDTCSAVSTTGASEGGGP